MGIEPAVSTSGPGDLTVQSDPADPDALVVTWLGGLADTDASIYFWRADTGYWLQVTVHKKPGLGGPALGIPRALRIHVRTPIDAAAVSIAGS